MVRAHQQGGERGVPALRESQGVARERASAEEMAQAIERARARARLVVFSFAFTSVVYHVFVNFLLSPTGESTSRGQ